MDSADGPYPADPTRPVLEYASPGQTPMVGRGPRFDAMDLAAGCAVVAVAALAAVGAVGLFTIALARLGSPDADPFGPAFMFCGAVVLAAVAVTCGRAALPGRARQNQS